MQSRAGAAVRVGVVVAVLPWAHAEGQVGTARGPSLSPAWVSLGCSNPGSQQDIAKTPVIKNTTGAAIPRGRSLSWKASDHDAGSVTLGQDLAPGDTVKGAGKAGQIYTCTARFDAGQPDLIIASAALGSTISATVKNTNAWTDAGPSTTRFELLKCSDARVLAVAKVGPLVVAAGATQTFTPVMTKPAKPPPSYWRITADVDRKIAEANEKNNVWSNKATCPR